MNVQNAFLPKELQEYQLTKKLNFEYGTRFKFLEEHYGFRPKCIHMILGATSGGKSTLVRSLLFDIYTMNGQLSNIMIWLSEESVEDFQIELITAPLNGTAKRNLRCISELDLDGDEQFFTDMVIQEKPSILILDNITTSRFYNDLRPKEQADFIRRLRKLAEAHEIALVLVAHTGAEININHKRLINMNDIRGNKTIVNLAQFFYIMQQFQINQQLFNSLRVTKNRGYNCEHSLFFLKYDRDKRIFTGDEAKDFESFKQIFDKRNKL